MNYLEKNRHAKLFDRHKKYIFLIIKKGLSLENIWMKPMILSPFLM